MFDIAIKSLIKHFQYVKEAALVSLLERPLQFFVSSLHYNERRREVAE